MERRAEVELDAGELEEVAPNMTSEHGVPIADDGGREPMEANNGVEEPTFCMMIRLILISTHLI